jgi:hypothetical protein
LNKFVVYIDVTADELDVAQQALSTLGSEQGVSHPHIEVEETVRSIGAAEIASITMTLTSIGGAIGATSMVLDKLQNLVRSIRGVHRAMIDTPEGPKPLESAKAADLEPK